MHHLIIVTAFAFVNLVTVNGQINCEIHADQKLVCSTQNYENILKSNLISDYNNLTEVTLKNCEITNIEDDAFKNYSNLKSVDLSINRITEVGFGLLIDSTKLTYLNFSHNKLITLPVGIFNEKPNLDVLDLSNNKIDSLPIGLFDYLENLSYLDISSNGVFGEYMDPDMFKDLTKMEHLDFSRNDLSGTSAKVFETFTNLKYLKLHKCLLDEVPNFVIKPNLKTVIDLELSTNHIAKLVDKGIFEYFFYLKALNLADNVIDEINEEVFQPMKNLETLNLKKNRLVSLPDNLFEQLRSLKYLDLSYNDIEYVPVTAFSGTVLKTLNLAYNRFSFLEPKFLFQLRNLGITLNVFHFNDNPWQCACLNEILIEAKMFDVSYKSIKYNGFHPVCVTSREFVCKREPSDNSHFIDLYQNDILIDR